MHNSVLDHSLHARAVLTAGLGFEPKLDTEAVPVAEVDVPCGGVSFEIGGRIGEGVFARCTISYAPVTGRLRKLCFEDYEATGE